MFEMAKLFVNHFHMTRPSSGLITCDTSVQQEFVKLCHSEF